MRIIDLIQAKIFGFSAVMGFIATPVINYFQRYFFSDWDFLGFLTTIFIVDTISGVMKHWKNHTLSLNGFMRVFIKMFVSLGALFVTHALAHFEGAQTTFSSYTETFGQTAVIIYVATSAVRNLHQLSGKKLPLEWLMKRFEEIAPKPENKTAK